MFTKDTVRLVVQFKDFNGTAINPDNVKLTIYDKQEEIIEEITDEIIDLSQGNYHYDYVAPEHDFIFEFSGVYNNKSVLARQLVQTKFI